MISVVSNVGTVDEYGEHDDASPVLTQYPAAFWAPAGDVQEDGRSRHGVTTDRDIYLPCGAVVESDNDIDIDGTRYRIIDGPAVWEHPWSGWKPGIVVRCSRTVG